MKTRVGITLLTAGLIGLTGCSDSNNGSSDDPLVGGVNERRLRSVGSSETFYAELREALRHQRDGYGYYGGDVVDSVTGGADFDSGAVGGGTTDGAGDGVSAPTSNGDDNAVADTGSESTGGADVTGTNVQEIGVDEADRIKVTGDGNTLYVLRQDPGYYYPVFVGPAVDVAFPTDTVDVGGGADGVAGGSAGVSTDGSTGSAGDPGSVGDTSSVDAIGTDDIAVDPMVIPEYEKGKSLIRVLSLDAAAPDAQLLKELELDLGGRQADGLYLYEGDSADSLIVTSSGFGGYWGYWDTSLAFAASSSRITRVDVSNPSNASQGASLDIDGQIVSSRRIGKHLFVATRYSPYVSVLPYEVDESTWNQTVDDADLDALMPTMRSSTDNIPEPLFDPSGCFVAPKSSANAYYTPDIVTLSVIDLDTLQLTDSECFLGASETLYASPNAVYLATTRWDYSDMPAIDFDDAIEPGFVYQDPRVDTDIHQFAINGGDLAYIGTGQVSGHLGWEPLRKPFRMSEKDGYLRVATFADRQASDVSPINVTVLQPNGAGELVQVGRLPNPNRPAHIGKPGEQLYASRFLGNKGYLVTYRQTDPLYVVDLSNPADPFLAGELEIAGYSDYLHPIDENYLLGIGKHAVPSEDGGRGDGRGGLVQGVKLSLFDVSNPSAPSEVQSVVVGERGTESQALYNHRAITVQAANELHPTRVAFTIDVAGNYDPALPVPAGYESVWHPWNYTGLHGFEVRTGADAGIVRNGAMVVERASSLYNWPQYGYDDRSVIVNDSVFYVHGSDVFSANWFDLSSMQGPR